MQMSLCGQSRDLTAITEQNLNISLDFCILVGLHEWLCVCGHTSACVMSVLWVGKGSLLRQTALWSTHQVSNCALLRTTSRKPTRKSMNKLVRLKSLPVLPSLQPPPPHLLLVLFLCLPGLEKCLWVLSVYSFIHRQWHKKLHQRAPFTYLINNVHDTFKRQFVIVRLIMIAQHECITQILKRIRTGALCYTKTDIFCGILQFIWESQKPDLL